MKELGVIIVITLSITAESPPCNHTPPSLTNSQQSLVIVFVNGSNDCMYASVCYTRLHGPRHLLILAIFQATVSTVFNHIHPKLDVLEYSAVTSWS